MGISSVGDEAGHGDEVAGQVGDADRLAHLQDAELAVVAERRPRSTSPTASGMVMK